MAGTDTTRNQLAAAVYVICDRPDQWRLLGSNPNWPRVRPRKSSGIPR